MPSTGSRDRRGAIVWKLGGNSIVGDGEQHLAVEERSRREPSMASTTRASSRTTTSRSIDDHTWYVGAARGVEYHVDTQAGTATLVWQYAVTRRRAQHRHRRIPPLRAGQRQPRHLGLQAELALHRGGCRRRRPLERRVCRRGCGVQDDQDSAERVRRRPPAPDGRASGDAVPSSLPRVLSLGVETAGTSDRTNRDDHRQRLHRSDRGQFRRGTPPRRSPSRATD